MKKAYIIISIVLVCLALTTFLLVNKNDFTTQSDQPQSSVKTDTLYRILKSDGDTAIWNAKDCNVHSSFFSCVRHVPRPKSHLSNHPQDRGILGLLKNIKLSPKLAIRFS